MILAAMEIEANNAAPEPMASPLRSTSSVTGQALATIALTPR
jgi:hypothetical protein